MKTLEISRPPARISDAGHVLWSLGFRPFYLLASLFASFSVLLWVAQYAGYLPADYLPGSVWHGHEMLFGYTTAVIAGFLMTAVRNWTGKPTPSGRMLASLALLWIAGRLMMLTPYGVAAAVVNAAFPLAVATGIVIPLARGNNRRNYFFIGLLSLLGLADLGMHFSQLGVFAWPARLSLQVGLDVVLFVLTVMAGRVIPMFTNNGVPGAKATRQPWLEKSALGSVLALLATDLLQFPAEIIFLLAALAALAQAGRLWLWQPWRTLSAPMVWILHLAYGWIVIYLILRSLATVGLVSELLAVHALTIGAIGGMTLGMMTRTARGHTGRPVTADAYDVSAYVLVQCAAVVRVFGGLLIPDHYLASVTGSGLLWSAAFILYAVRYSPSLLRPSVE